MQTVYNLHKIVFLRTLSNKYTSLFQTDLIKVNLNLISVRFESNWLRHNDKIYPPQKPGEDPRPAFVCHEIRNIKYSPKKMWYVSCIVRGMTCEEALKQLKSCSRKGAVVIAQAIKEAQDMAVKEHNVEYKTNLWIAESFSSKGIVVKGLRRRGKGNMNIIRYRYCHYFIRLEEGQPPQDYYCRGPQTRTGPILLEKWFDKMRNRKIINSL